MGKRGTMTKTSLLGISLFSGILSFLALTTIIDIVLSLTVGKYISKIQQIQRNGS